MILYEIAESTRKRVAELKREKNMDQIMNEAKSLPSDTGFPFEKTLRTDRIALICEVKKASPSKGIISEKFPYLRIAKTYEEAGAEAISVLTEPHYFMGSDRYLKEIAQLVRIPVLRKDFTVDAYQIYETKCLGASAVLLICTLLDTATLAEFIKIAHSLGLSALVEAHSAEEVRSAVQAGARIIGVNNRDLQTFRVDITISLRLRPLVPEHILYVSESGISTAKDIAALRKIGTDAVLMGETLMRSSDIKRQISILRGDIRDED